jgi:hypothetical protein
MLLWFSDRQAGGSGRGRGGGAFASWGVSDDASDSKAYGVASGGGGACIAPAPQLPEGGGDGSNSLGLVCRTQQVDDSFAVTLDFDASSNKALSL